MLVRLRYVIHIIIISSSSISSSSSSSSVGGNCNSNCADPAGRAV
jgi:hypothetical protein